jgi:hypothetical protein
VERRSHSLSLAERRSWRRERRRGDSIR